MPRQAIQDWLPYLEDVLALWTELPEEFKVGALAKTDIVTLRDHLKGTLDHLDALQAQTGLTMGERDHDVSELEDFAVKFRAAVIAQFGNDSVEARRVPKINRSRRNKTTPPTTQ